MIVAEGSANIFCTVHFEGSPSLLRFVHKFEGSANPLCIVHLRGRLSDNDEEEEMKRS